MRRKLLSVVLCVCMMLTMAPFAFAAENSEAPTGAAQGQESSSGSGGSSSNSLPEADSNGIITLTESVSIPAGPTTTAEIEGNLWTNLLKNDTTIDLNGKTLIVTDGENGNVVLASRNMANLHVIEPSSINVLDLVGADNLLIDVASVNKIEEVLK